MWVRGFPIGESAGNVAIGGSVISGTAGSLLFVDASNCLGQDNDQLYWDVANYRLGVAMGTSPLASIDVGIAASVSGTPAHVFQATGAAHTAITTTVEYNALHVNLAQTYTWAAGNIASQRFVAIDAPTIAFASGSNTVANAATFYVSAGPTQGTNATLTNSYAIWSGGAIAIKGTTATSFLHLDDGHDAAISAAGTARIRYNNDLGHIQASINGAAWGQLEAVMAIGDEVQGGTAGSVLWVDSGVNLAQDNDQFFWDQSNFRLGVALSSTTVNASLDVAQAAAATTTAHVFQVTGAAHTALTATTEWSPIHLNLGQTVTWDTGALTLQRFLQITAPTVAFVGASTATSVATVAISGAPVKGANATLTATHALLVEAGAVSTATASYGLTVNTQTGGTANYCAAFLGGKTGFGLATPAAVVDVLDIATTSGVPGPVLQASAANHTNITASSEWSAVNITLAATTSWLAGAITKQRFINITPGSIAFDSSSTVTDAATFSVGGAPTKGTNATLTRTHAIMVEANAVSTAAASYGIYCNAQTGATANYSAAFLGGRVGIGTSAPVGLLHVNGAGSQMGTTTAYYLDYVNLNSGDQYGIALGYDTNTGGGMIAGATAASGASIGFWTYNGSAWGERARIAKEGNVLLTPGAYSSAISVTTGAWFNLASQTHTVTDAGTVASWVGSAIQVPTITKGSAVTITDAATLYVAGPPTAGGSVTITNGWAGWFAGRICTTSAGSGSNIKVHCTTNSGYADIRIFNDQNSAIRCMQVGYTGSAYGSVYFTGGPVGEQGGVGTTGAYPLVFGTNNTAVLQFTAVGAAKFTPSAQSADNDDTTATNHAGTGVGAYFNQATATYTDSGDAGTRSSWVDFQILGKTHVGTAVITTTDAATLYVTPPTASTNSTITNAWSIWASGNARVDGGTLYLNNGTSNRLYFGSNGGSVPGVGTVAGEKITLYDTGAGAVHYCIGMLSAEIWTAIDTTAAHFSWYGATTEVFRIEGVGTVSQIPQAKSYSFAGTPTVGRLWNTAAVTHTATDGAGTVATWYGHALQAPTLSGAAADRIVTDAATLYVAAPLESTMVITNHWAGWFDGRVYVNSTDMPQLVVKNSTSHSCMQFYENSNYSVQVGVLAGGTAIYQTVGRFDLTLGTNGGSKVTLGAYGSWSQAPDALSGTPSTTGGYWNLATATFTDNNTAGSGTAAAFTSFAIQAPTLAATNATVTTTNASTLYVSGGVISSTNETITNSHALYIAAGDVKGTGATTNSYGLTVNAQTDATNNYCAQFLGGYVSIGAAAPTSWLVLAPTATSGNPATYATTGIWANTVTQTFTDSSTAASGTATSWVGTSWQTPTYTATNDNVTLSDSAVTYVGANATTGGVIKGASTGLALTRSYSLWTGGNCWLDGSLRHRYTNVNASTYTVLLTDYYIGVAYTATGTCEVTLPSAVTAGDGRVYWVKDEGGNAGTFNITVKASAGTLDGVAAGTGVTMDSNYQALGFYSNGTNWFLV